MATEAAAASESDTEKDIGQFARARRTAGRRRLPAAETRGTRPGVSPPHARPAASHRRRHRVCDRCRVRQRAGPPGHTAGVGLRTIREGEAAKVYMTRKLTAKAANSVVLEAYNAMKGKRRTSLPRPPSRKRKPRTKPAPPRANGETERLAVRRRAAMQYRLAGASYRSIAAKLTEDRANAYADANGITASSRPRRCAVVWDSTPRPSVYGKGGYRLFLKPSDSKIGWLGVSSTHAVGRNFSGCDRITSLAGCNLAATGCRQGCT